MPLPLWDSLLRRAPESTFQRALRSSGLFPGLTDRELGMLEATAHVRTYQAGEEVFRRGSRGAGMFLILEGTVQIAATEGPKSQTAELQPGDFFGELALVEEDVRSATATATSATSLALIARSNLEEIGRRNPSLGEKLMRDLARVLADRLKRAEALLQQSSQSIG